MRECDWWMKSFQVSKWLKCTLGKNLSHILYNMQESMYSNFVKQSTFFQTFGNVYRKEIQQIKGSSYIRGVLLSFIVFHTRIALFFSILSYVLFGNYITAQKVNSSSNIYTIIYLNVMQYVHHNIFFRFLS